VDGAASGSGTSSGDLAKPTAGLKTVALYNYQTGFYELLDKDALLDGTSAEPVAIMDSASLEQLEQLNAAGESTAGPLAPADFFAEAMKTGIPIFIAVLAAIGVLLMVLFNRRSKITKY
jgi:hypothetical protein